MEPGTTTVHIYGQQYTVRSEDDPQHVQRVAAYVDGRMREVARGSAQVTSMRVAILAALNIADELLRERDASNHGAERLRERARQLATALEQTMQGAAEAAAGESASGHGENGQAAPNSGQTEG